MDCKTKDVPVDVSLLNYQADPSDARLISTSCAGYPPDYHQTSMRLFSRALEKGFVGVASCGAISNIRGAPLAAAK